VVAATFTSPKYAAPTNVLKRGREVKTVSLVRLRRKNVALAAIFSAYLIHEAPRGKGKCKRAKGNRSTIPLPRS
jgi:hypothetical protein